MVRTIVEGVLVALLIIAGVSWWNTREDRNAQRERATQYEQDLLEASQRSDSLEVALIELDSLMATRDSIHEAEISEAESAVNEQGQVVDSLLQVVLEQVPDSVREVVQELHNSYQEQLSNKDIIIRSLRDQVAIRDTRILARDGLITSLQIEVQEATDLARFWEKEAKPSFGIRLKKNIGIITTSALIGSVFTYALVSN